MLPLQAGIAIDSLLALDDEKICIPSPSVHSTQNVNINRDSVPYQRERYCLFEDEDYREVKKRKMSISAHDIGGSSTEHLNATNLGVTKTAATTTAMHTTTHQQVNVSGLNHHPKMRQYQQLYQQQGANQSLQLLQLQQQVIPSQKTQTAPPEQSYQVFDNNTEQVRPQSQLLRPTVDATFFKPSPLTLNQAISPLDTGPQEQQEQSLQSQLASLKHISPFLPNPILPQAMQLPRIATSQSPAFLLNPAIQQVPPFPAAAMLNQNFVTSTGATICPMNSVAFVPPDPRRGSIRIPRKKPVTLYIPCDDESLSQYQCLVRKNIELFEADEDELDGNAKGRNKPIVMGQVGIRCKRCSSIPQKSRCRGSKYYPAKLSGLYQAAQSMASGHLCNHCTQISQSLRDELLLLREKKSSAGGGKEYWADGARVLGVVEDEKGLRFKGPS